MNNGNDFGWMFQPNLWSSSLPSSSMAPTQYQNTSMSAVTTAANQDPSRNPRLLPHLQSSTMHPMAHNAAFTSFGQWPSLQAHDQLQYRQDYASANWNSIQTAFQGGISVPQASTSSDGMSQFQANDVFSQFDVSFAMPQTASDYRPPSPSPRDTEIPMLSGQQHLRTPSPKKSSTAPEKVQLKRSRPCSPPSPSERGPPAKRAKPNAPDKPTRYKGAEMFSSFPEVQRGQATSVVNARKPEIVRQSHQAHTQKEASAGSMFSPPRQPPASSVQLDGAVSMNVQPTKLIFPPSPHQASTSAALAHPAAQVHSSSPVYPSSTETSVGSSTVRSGSIIPIHNPRPSHAYPPAPLVRPASALPIHMLGVARKARPPTPKIQKGKGKAELAIPIALPSVEQQLDLATSSSVKLPRSASNRQGARSSTMHKRVSSSPLAWNAPPAAPTPRQEIPASPASSTSRAPTSHVAQSSAGNSKIASERQMDGSPVAAMQLSKTSHLSAGSSQTPSHTPHQDISSPPAIVRPVSAQQLNSKPGSSPSLAELLALKAHSDAARREEAEPKPESAESAVIALPARDELMFRPYRFTFNDLAAEYNGIKALHDQRRYMYYGWWSNMNLLPRSHVDQLEWSRGRYQRWKDEYLKSLYIATWIDKCVTANASMQITGAM